MTLLLKSWSPGARLKHPLAHRERKGPIRTPGGAASLGLHHLFPRLSQTMPRYSPRPTVSSVRKRTQSGLAASPTLQDTSHEVCLGLTSQESLGESVGLNHWESEVDPRGRACSNLQGIGKPHSCWQVH